MCLIPGTVNEDNFLNGCLKLPQPLLEEALNFELLPSYMRQELHNKLPEVKIQSYLAPVFESVTHDSVNDQQAFQIFFSAYLAFYIKT